MLKFILCMVLCCATSLHPKNFSFPTLTTEALAQVQAYQQLHPTSAFTITITGPQTIFGSCNAYAQKTARVLHGISLQNIAMKGLASLLGATALSYAFIAYFIYRVYKLIARISSWLAWNEEVHEHDMIEEAKQYLARTRAQKPITRSSHKRHSCLQELREEETLIRTYISLNTFLKKYNMRAFFCYDAKKEKQLEYALHMLAIAADLDKKETSVVDKILLN